MSPGFSGEIRSLPGALSFLFGGGTPEPETVRGLLLDEIKGPMQEKGILFGYDEDAARLIAKKSFGDRSGGRAIRRTIRREVEDRIAELLVERAGDHPAMLKVTAEGDEIRLIHG